MYIGYWTLNKYYYYYKAVEWVVRESDGKITSKNGTGLCLAKSLRASKVRHGWLEVIRIYVMTTRSHGIGTIHVQSTSWTNKR